jgi:hypothetical protein
MKLPLFERHDIFKVHCRDEISPVIFDLDAVLEVQVPVQHVCASDVSGARHCDPLGGYLVGHVLPFLVPHDSIVVEVKEETRHRSMERRILSAGC